MPMNSKVLFVDDDINLLNAARRVLRKDIDLETAQGGSEALSKLEASNEYSVVVSDQNMPDMNGVALLSQVAERWPLTARIMLTGNDDQKTAIMAVNDGRIFRFVRKPCQPSDLLEAIRDAARHHQTQVAERQLLEQTLFGSVKMLTNVLSMAQPEIFRRSMQVQSWTTHMATSLKMKRPWELKVAAMLYPIGLVALPESVACKYARGEVLSDAEHAAIDESGRAAQEIIKNIPRLDGVAEAVFYCRKGFDGSGFPDDDIAGNDIPIGARLLRVLIDLADLHVGGAMSLADAIAALQSKAQIYDPEILQAAIASLSKLDGAQQPSAQGPLAVKLWQLKAGQKLARDILDKSGKLLLASGFELTPITVQKLQNLQKVRQIADTVYVIQAA